MRAVVQRVAFADVTVDEQVTGSIQHGLMVLLGVGALDETKDLEYLVDKVTGLRIFGDEKGKMNRSVVDAGGSLLVVSQFTLYADCRKGRRPGFTDAASPEKAKEYYERFLSLCAAKGIPVEAGIFQAEMMVRIHNDGPVTILLDSSRLF